MSNSLQKAESKFKEYILERENNAPQKNGTINSAKDFLAWYSDTITDATKKANEIANDVELQTEDADSFRNSILKQIREFQAKYS